MQLSQTSFHNCLSLSSRRLQRIVSLRESTQRIGVVYPVVLAQVDQRRVDVQELGYFVGTGVVARKLALNQFGIGKNTYLHVANLGEVPGCQLEILFIPARMPRQDDGRFEVGVMKST